MIAPPSALATAGEALAGLEFVRLAARTPSLRRTPRGDGAPVVLVPGFGASDTSLLPLRRFLRQRGHDARSAGFGRMTDDVGGLARRLIELATELRRETGRSVRLVGWSIGGVVSREAARERPEVIARVVTFGSPVVGGPAATTLARRYPDERLEQIKAMIAARNRIPIEVPITAMWSRRDGIVAPQACIDHHSRDVEHVEVRSTHLGMGVDPDVWSVTAHRLAR